MQTTGPEMRKACARQDGSSRKLRCSREMRERASVEFRGLGLNGTVVGDDDFFNAFLSRL